MSLVVLLAALGAEPSLGALRRTQLALWVHVPKVPRPNAPPRPARPPFYLKRASQCGGTTLATWALRSARERGGRVAWCYSSLHAADCSQSKDFAIPVSTACIRNVMFNPPLTLTDERCRGGDDRRRGRGWSASCQSRRRRTMRGADRRCAAGEVAQPPPLIPHSQASAHFRARRPDRRARDVVGDATTTAAAAAATHGVRRPGAPRTRLYIIMLRHPLDRFFSAVQQAGRAKAGRGVPAEVLQRRMLRGCADRRALPGGALENFLFNRGRMHPPKPLSAEERVRRGLEALSAPDVVPLVMERWDESLELLSLLGAFEG